MEYHHTFKRDVIIIQFPFFIEFNDFWEYSISSTKYLA